MRSEYDGIGRCSACGVAHSPEKACSVAPDAASGEQPSIANISFPLCPACNAECIKYDPETAVTYASWRFACDGEIVLMENGHLDVNSSCRGALEAIITKKNKRNSH